MEARQKFSPDNAGWRDHVAVAAIFTIVSMTGCASFWDDVTSRDFKVKSLFVQPDPLVVLQTSTDGDLRAKALRALKEPISHGGTQADQDEVMKILTAAAVTDKQPICRLAAMQTLGRFKDPRAASVLTDSFYKANNFAPDTTTMLRCHALKSLGETGNTAGVELLVKVVREPRSEGTEVERQNAMDVRLAAARALGHYNDPQASAALFQVMRSEKDVGLRMCAYESLKTSTGKKMLPDSNEWDSMIQLAGVTLPPTGAPVTPALAGDKSTLTPVGGRPTSAGPASGQPAAIQQMSDSSPAGLPGTSGSLPASSLVKP